MKSYITFISTIPLSHVFSIISFIVAVIGVCLTIYYYRKGRRLKEVSYSIQSNTLMRDLTDEFPKLAISFDDNDITALTITQVAIWNSGTESIREADISKSDPLRIPLPEGSKLLDYNFKKTVNNANQFSIRHCEQKHSIIISFEYVDQNDGVIINFIHSGSTQDTEIFGSIIGVPKLIYRDVFFTPDDIEPYSLTNRPFRNSVVVVISGILLLFLAAWSPLTAKILILLYSGIQIFGGLYIISIIRKEKGLPKGLRFFNK
ncbi:MAG: hypothetical protein PF482_19915 [Desulfobacteraceae bacterium]|jgi:uncharacterized protein YkuJ|nr:hypothetical protein [Desulfobacteraceae bacterium]